MGHQELLHLLNSLPGPVLSAISHVILTAHLSSIYYHNAYFTHKETEVQSGESSFPRSHGNKGQSGSGSQVFLTAELVTLNSYSILSVSKKKTT